MSKVDQKIREMDYYFEDVQRTNLEIEELMAADPEQNQRKIKKK